MTKTEVKKDMFEDIMSFFKKARTCCNCHWWELEQMACHWWYIWRLLHIKKFSTFQPWWQGCFRGVCFL